MEYLKADIPYNIVNIQNIILTYNEINLKYIANKNYFKIINKTPGHELPEKSTNVSEQNFKDLSKTSIKHTGSNKFKSEKIESHSEKKENYKKGGIPIMVYF